MPMLSDDIAIRQERRLAALGHMTAHRLHELNNLVMILTGHIELLEHQDGVPSGYLEKCKSAAWRTSEVLRSLVALATSDQRGLVWQQVVDVAASLLAHRLQSEDIQLDLQIEQRLPVSGDGMVIGQVLFELMTNAAESLAGCYDKTIRVVVAREGADVVVCRVIDNGQGLAPDEARRALAGDLGRQGDRRRPPIFLHPGQGLARCRQLLEELDGSLTLHGRPSGGAEAVMRLPTG